MNRDHDHWRRLAGLVLVFTATAAGAAVLADTEFMKQNASVMSRMMAAMDVRSSGNVDVDFVNLMEPHHRAAIEMAHLELRHGRNEQLRRIAQEIIVGQQQEIVAMRLALGRPLPPARRQEQ